MKKTKDVSAVKRAAPDFTGTPGELVAIEGLALVFGKAGRTSPYDGLLDSLAAAGSGQALKFGDVKAKASVYARAKKKSMRVSFAELGGALYVRFDGEVDADLKATRRAAIRALLKKGAAMSAIGVSAALREGGDKTMDGEMAGAILAQMLRDGEVVKQDGGNWRLAVGK